MRARDQAYALDAPPRPGIRTSRLRHVAVDKNSLLYLVCMHECSCRIHVVIC